MTVDAYDRRLDTYFVREGMNRKYETADLEKITREEYKLDWSQSKVTYFLCIMLKLTILAVYLAGISIVINVATCWRPITVPLTV